MVMRRLVLRGCLLVGGVCVGGLVFVFWLHAGAGAGAPSLAAGVSGRGAVARLAGLPPAEQAVISRTLGAVSPGFAVVRTPGGYGLSAGGLRAHFGRERALFAAPGGGLSLALRAVGRGAVLEPFRAVQLGVRSNRVSYSGVGVGEWFVGGPLGIEQGFTLARRPAGGGGPLTLALRVSGLTPRLGARGAVFADAAGRPVLRYGALAARDARGRALAAWLVVGRTGLEIQVADRGARYPVRVDPFIQLAKLTASDGAAGDQLGSSVAVSGDTVVAGALNAAVGGHSQQGAAYVFTKPAAGWSDESQAAKLTASDGATGEQLGFSVAVSGDTVVAGAVNAAVAGHFEQGAAYVFTKPAAGWSSETQEAKPTASDGAAVDELGRSVAVSGDTVVAGAPLATVAGHSFQGAAYVFAVVVPPSIQKAFGASSIPLNGSTSLSFTVTNPNGSASLSGVGFTDSLPAGLVVSSPNGSSGSCGSGTVTATAGSGSVSLSGGTIAAGADCSFSVNVTGTSAGVKNNTTGNVTSTEGGTGNTASASLTVVAAPTATISSPADNRSFNLGQSVSTTFSCSEAANGPGIGSCTDQNGSSSPAKLDTSKVGTFTYRVTATSKDGQTRTAQVSYTVVGRPTAQISSPAEGQKFNLRQSVSTTFSCSEAASAPGISSCTDQNGSSSPGKLDTSKAGTFTYKVTATSKDGQTATATISYTVKHPIPRLRSLRLSRRRFYAATHRPTIAALETGTTITYTDTLAARTTFRVLRCAARGRRPCSRLVSVGSFTHRDHKGINRVRFTGWLRGRPLTPGSYVLRLSATLAGQKSTGLSTSFQIVARPPACSDPDNDGDCPGQT
jgi:hypothetical protein